MTGGTLEALGNGGSTTAREVLFLVPELLFLVFMAVVAVDSGIGFVASLLSSSDRYSRATEAHGGEARLMRPSATLLTAGGVAILAATAVHVLLLSLRVVLEAPVAVVIMATATVVLAVAASVVVVATVLVAVGASALVLVSNQMGYLTKGTYNKNTFWMGRI